MANGSSSVSTTCASIGPSDAPPPPPPLPAVISSPLSVGREEACVPDADVQDGADDDEDDDEDGGAGADACCDDEDDDGGGGGC